MKRSRRAGFAFAVLLVLAAPGAARPTGDLRLVPPPPPTPVAEVRDTLHGVEIVDPYRWLEDQQSPETRAWIAAQNAYADSLLGAIPGRDAMRERLERLLRVDAATVPVVRNGRHVYTRRGAEQELSVIATREGLAGREQVVVDPHGWTPDRSLSVTVMDVSDDGRLLAYGVRRGGEDELVVRFLDLDTRAALPDSLPLARYLGISIRPDRSGLLYSRFGEDGPRVLRHDFGGDPARDAVVFGEGRGRGELIATSLSPNGRWAMFVVLHGSAASRVEVWAQNLASGAAPFAIVDDLDATFTPVFAGDRLYLKTDWNAPNGRVLAVDLTHPAREAWGEVIPETQSPLGEIAAVNGRIVAHYLEDVASRLRVFEADGRPAGEIPLPAAGTVMGLRGDWEGGQAWLSYSSLAIPTTIYRVDPTARRLAEWWRSKVAIARGEFVMEQVWFASKDGTRVPMFLLHRRGVRPDGNRPALLFGYGGFRQSMQPAFRADAARWAEMGGVFAMACLRGGSEFGEPWHRAGMLERKQNTFDDFVAAAEWLVANRWTNPSRLAIAGGSNGGLLVGAAMTQRPDLFRAVACSVPLLDMLRYHRFLVARFWVPEYGSSEDPRQFEWLRAYSPYHHVLPGVKYPAAIFLSGDSDTRVAPLHARKMTALLQAASASGWPVLLHYDTRAGHSRGRPIGQTIEEETDRLLFLAWQLGVDAAAIGGAAKGAGRARSAAREAGGDRPGATSARHAPAPTH